MLHSQSVKIPSQEPTYTHSLQPLIPTCLSHPRKCAPSLLNSPSVAPLPFQGFTNKLDKNSQSTIATVGLPPGEITSSTTSLTWRELLTGLTICFFFSNKLSHLERVAYRSSNLPLHSMGMTIRLFTLAPR
jgi:hypothetical protein